MCFNFQYVFLKFLLEGVHEEGDAFVTLILKLSVAWRYFAIGLAQFLLPSMEKASIFVA